MIDHHTALIYTMVLVSASDREMTDSELRTMGDIVRQLPVFRDYDEEGLTDAANDCAKLLGDANGLDRALAMIRAGLPDKLRGTAYALACDIAAADGRATQEELRLLEMLRHGLEVTRLKAAAIEHAVRVRYMTL